MSNLWFNIRVGMTHYTLSREWEFSASENEHHRDNPKRFQIHCLFW